MSSTTKAAFERYKQGCEADRGSARRKTATDLRGVLGVEFSLSGWSRRAEEAIKNQWVDRSPDVDHWEWSEIIRRHKDADQFDLSIWCPDDRLSGLAFGLLKATSLELMFLEGDPRADCPLKGRRALIALDCAANYAQKRGKEELSLYPINDRLRGLYVDTYGFVERGKYFVKRI